MNAFNAELQLAIWAPEHLFHYWSELVSLSTLPTLNRAIPESSRDTHLRSPQDSDHVHNNAGDLTSPPEEPLPQ